MFLNYVFYKRKGLLPECGVHIVAQHRHDLNFRPRPSARAIFVGLHIDGLSADSATAFAIARVCGTRRLR
jgi:methionine aminopeptidase